MRTDFPARLQLELNSPEKRLAYTWKVTRRDGKVFGFTSFDNDLTLSDGVVYKAGTGMTPSAITSKSDLSADNMTVEVLIDSVDIKEEDILNGLWDMADIECGVCVYTSPLNSYAVLKTGTLGNIDIDGKGFTTELRSLMQQLQQGAISLYAPSCNVEFGSKWCGKNANDYTFSATVTSITSPRVFTIDLVKADAFFDYGKITVTSGQAVGMVGDIRSHSSNTITLWINLPIALSVGDTLTLVQGCDKRMVTCKDVFNNVINFQGFPYIPGTDKIVAGVSYK